VKYQTGIYQRSRQLSGDSQKGILVISFAKQGCKPRKSLSITTPEKVPLGNKSKVKFALKSADP
jgi:hypothetical protein